MFPFYNRWMYFCGCAGKLLCLREGGICMYQPQENAGKSGGNRRVRAFSYILQNKGVGFGEFLL